MDKSNKYDMISRQVFVQHEVHTYIERIWWKKKWRRKQLQNIMADACM